MFPLLLISVLKLLGCLERQTSYVSSVVRMDSARLGGRVGLGIHAPTERTRILTKRNGLAAALSAPRRPARSRRTMTGTNQKPDPDTRYVSGAN